MKDKPLLMILIGALIAVVLILLGFGPKSAVATPKKKSRTQPPKPKNNPGKKTTSSPNSPQEPPAPAMPGTTPPTPPAETTSALTPTAKSDTRMKALQIERSLITDPFNVLDAGLLLADLLVNPLEGEVKKYANNLFVILFQFSEDGVIFPYIAKIDRGGVLLYLRKSDVNGHGVEWRWRFKKARRAFERASSSQVTGPIVTLPPNEGLAVTA